VSTLSLCIRLEFVLYFVLHNKFRIHETDEVAGGRRGLQNEELRNLHSSPNVIKENEIGGTCSTHGSDDICIYNFDRKI
jgi:hypothetical protein